MPFSARYGVRTGAAGCGGRALKTDFMISAVYYIFLVFLCTFFMVLSAVALAFWSASSSPCLPGGGSG